VIESFSQTEKSAAAQLELSNNNNIMQKERLMIGESLKEAGSILVAK
jgi:hypothetical protein